MKKRIIIISSILIVLFAAGFITIQIIYGTINYFSKTVESSFNLSLKNIKKKSEDFKLTYNDFKCSGKRSIECYGKKILYDKDRYKIEVKDINFILTPYYKSADFSFNAGVSYKIFVDESFKYHTSTIYFKNKEFNEKNIYEFSKKFDNFINDKSYLKKVSGTSFAVDYIKGYIKSKDLFQEYVNIMRRFDANYEYDRESAMISTQNFNAEKFFTSSVFGEDSFEYNVLGQITDNVRNIIHKYHNRLSYNITRKGGKPIEKYFISNMKQAVNIIYNTRSYHIDTHTSKK